MKTNLTIRVDKNDKEIAAAILKHLGLDLSSAINMYLRQIIMKGGIPFMIELEMNEETKQACEDAEKGTNLSKPYRSFKELMKDIDEGKDIFND